MACGTLPRYETRVSVFDEVVQAIRTLGIEAHADRSRAGRYLILKQNGKTVGYVQGTRATSVWSPRLDRRVLIANSIQIPFAVEFIEQYTQKEAAT